MSEPIRILMLEDEPEAAELNERALRKEGLTFTAQRVDTRAAYAAALAQWQPGVVLLDYKVPGLDGSESLHMAREACPEVPVIVVSGTVGEERAAELMKAGAYDFVLKDRLGRLGTAVRNALERAATRRERRSAAAALAESEQRFRSLIESTSDVICIADAEGRLSYLSPAVREVLGYLPEEMLGRGPADFVAPEDLPLLRQRMAELLRGPGAIAGLDLHMRHKDGTAVVVAATGRNLLDVPGIRGIAGSWHDVTARRQAEQTLRESEQTLRSITSAAMDAVLLIDEAGRISFWNEAAERIFGYTYSAAIGQPRELLVPQRDIAQFHDQLARLVATGSNDLTGRRTALPAVRKDGVEIVTEMSLSAVRRNGTWNSVEVIRDVTEQKRAEHARQAAVERAHLQLDALGRVTASDALVAGRFETLAREVTELAAAATCGAERANVWLFNDDETELRCIDLYEATPRQHSAGATLAEAQFQNEFRALKSAPFVNADDALTDPRTVGYVDAYLKPLGITSMLDAVIETSDRHLGLLCIEHVGKPHHWEPDEIAFASRLADKLGLCLANSHRNEVAARLAEAQRLTRDGLDQTVRSLASTVELRDPYTAGHQRRVAAICTALARELGMDDDMARGLDLAATIHDIGKVNVPAEILAKPGSLTPIEHALVATHAEAGYQILKDVRFPWPVAEIIRQHHERLDGSGYPRALKGEDILPQARVLAVADVIEAIASHRPYRAAQGLDAALDEIARGRGTLFDAAVVDAALRLFREHGFSIPA